MTTGGFSWLQISDEVTHKVFSHIAILSQVQRALEEYGNKALPTPMKEKVKVSIQLGDSVLLKAWKNMSPENQLQPKWKWHIKCYQVSNCCSSVGNY